MRDRRYEKDANGDIVEIIEGSSSSLEGHIVSVILGLAAGIVIGALLF